MHPCEHTTTENADNTGRDSKDKNDGHYMKATGTDVLKTAGLWALRLLLYGTLLFLAFNKHSKSGYYNYQSEIWADKAGYYVYLPATVQYGFKARAFPDSVDVKTGNGFYLNDADNTVQTKYTYGVALLQLPFYLAAHALAAPLGMAGDGFSPVYHWSINVAAVSYLFLGLLLLTKALSRQYGRPTALATTGSLLLGTHLYFYGIDDTGMSHVYSFFLFSAYLYMLQRSRFLQSTTWQGMLLFGIVAGLIVLIRPTNAIFLGAGFLLNLGTYVPLRAKLYRALELKNLLPILAGATVVILPQLVYWYYASGSVLYYSYQNEGFNWGSPKVVETLLAPNNGLLLYVPFFIVILFSSLYAMVRKNINGWVCFITFAILTYVLSSWWAWHFGCSFGGRSYVEYLALFAWPLAILYKNTVTKRWYVVTGLWLVVALMVVYNLGMTYSFDHCFFGNHTWDWDAYRKLVENAF